MNATRTIKGKRLAPDERRYLSLLARGARIEMSRTVPLPPRFELVRTVDEKERRDSIDRSMVTRLIAHGLLRDQGVPQPNAATLVISGRGRKVYRTGFLVEPEVEDLLQIDVPAAPTPRITD